MGRSGFQPDETACYDRQDACPTEDEVVTHLDVAAVAGGSR